MSGAEFGQFGFNPIVSKTRAWAELPETKTRTSWDYVYSDHGYKRNRAGFARAVVAGRPTRSSVLATGKLVGITIFFVLP
jgi:hypothetical protein